MEEIAINGAARADRVVSPEALGRLRASLDPTTGPPLYRPAGPARQPFYGRVDERTFDVQRRHRRGLGLFRPRLHGMIQETDDGTHVSYGVGFHALFSVLVLALSLLALGPIVYPALAPPLNWWWDGWIGSPGGSPWQPTFDLVMLAIGLAGGVVARRLRRPTRARVALLVLAGGCLLAPLSFLFFLGVRLGGFLALFVSISLGALFAAFSYVVLLALPATIPLGAGLVVLAVVERLTRADALALRTLLDQTLTEGTSTASGSSRD